jgi:hypothetical protein
MQPLSSWLVISWRGRRTQPKFGVRQLAAAFKRNGRFVDYEQLAAKAPASLLARKLAHSKERRETILLKKQETECL